MITTSPARIGTDGTQKMPCPDTPVWGNKTVKIGLHLLHRIVIILDALEWARK